MNNYMKKFTQILILSIFTILMVGIFTESALAAPLPPLSVTFSSDPLFKEVNFAPGGEVTGSASVSNNSGSSQNIIVEATNAVDNGGLGDKLNLTITESGNNKYTGKLGAFLRNGEVELSSLNDNTSTNYLFNITFDNNAENNLQGKNLGFDLCIGFQGGTMHCGNTVISDENGGGGSSTSGSYGGVVTLVIYNEQALNITNTDTSGSATINWNTNKLSTSQVIYGISSGSYNLDLNILPNLGYPLGSVEDGNKVMNHSVLLTGLIPGETYVYRVVSHASPATVSYEHQFTVPQQPLTEKNNLALNNNNGDNVQETGVENKESIAGIENASNNNIDNIKNTTNNNLLGASALSSGFDYIMSVCSIYGLLILILIYLVWKLWLRKKYEKKMVLEKEINDRFCLYFGVTSLAIIIILLLAGKYCPLWIFIISCILSTSFYAYRKLKK
jgi:hypothetical protein